MYEKSGNLDEICTNFKELRKIWENYQILSSKIVFWRWVGVGEKQEIGRNRVANIRKNGVGRGTAIRDGRVLHMCDF